MQAFIVALIVLAAAGYSAWRLMPAHWRLRAAQGTGTLAHATLAQPLAKRIEIRVVAAAENAGGCGNCGPCKACKTGQDATAEQPGDGVPRG